MRLRTEIEPLSLQGYIDHSTRIVMAGSCFTDEIGGRLRRAMFDVSVNPLGTLFNPISMAQELNAALYAAVEGRKAEWGLFSDGTKWHTMRRHSSFSMADREAMERSLDMSLAETGRRLADADLLIATFGSAIAFRHIASDKIVSNCHKRPASEFVRQNVTVGEISDAWTALIDRIRKVNPKLRLMMTVSPVRHVGYGLVADRRSKSALCLACHDVAERVSDALYYPSYEVFTDDLRDYRYYSDDLCHPSKTGVDYTMEHFSLSTMTEQTRQLAEQWNKLTARCMHRYSNPAEAEKGFEEARIAARSLAEATAKGSEASASAIYNRFTEFQNNTI